VKSPDEIKKGLDCCVDGNIVCAGNCVFDDDVKLGYPDCVKLLMTNAIALIQQLEADKQQLEGMLTHMNQLRDAAAGRALKMEERADRLEAERDAAVKDLENVCKLLSICNACKDRFEGGELCRGCFCSSHWQWRGVQKEE